MTTCGFACRIDAADHVRGPSTAPVTLLEYGDFDCPQGRQATHVIHSLLAANPGLRLVFRHLPLEGLHPHALAAAAAAECAAAQGRFWPMHDLLFEHQPHLKRHQLFHYARLLDLDTDRFLRELDNEVHVQKIRLHQVRGRRAQAGRAPAFWVNGQQVDLSRGLHALNLAVELALETRGLPAAPGLPPRQPWSGPEAACRQHAAPVPGPLLRTSAR